MRFEWDRRKAVANLAKHGVAFEEASSVNWKVGLPMAASPPRWSCGGFEIRERSTLGTTAEAGAKSG